MSDSLQWKVLHLLNVYCQLQLAASQLQAAGALCYPDTIQHLLDDDLLQEVSPATFHYYEYGLTELREARQKLAVSWAALAFCRGAKSLSH